MKFIHLSDLHIGKRVNGFSMMEDQEYILNEIINIIDNEEPQAVILAGDIYDKAIPQADAVELLDDFLVKLSERRLQVFVISGNHDSPERLAFGRRLMEDSGIYVAPVYDGNVKPFTVKDDYGEVNIFLLPFIKPVQVRKAFPQQVHEIESYNDAVRVAIENMDIDSSVRSVLVTHQFVTGAVRSESEDMTLSAGGSDNIDCGIFKKFDYVALGHIHKPQNIGSPNIRYCGTPLKYSFSESLHEKSVTVAELEEKGSLSVRTVPLKPMRDMVEIRGEYDRVTAKSFYEGTTYRSDYMHITLTDEEEIPEVIGRLRSVYPNLMKVDYHNTRTQSTGIVDVVKMPEVHMPLNIFEEFYEKQNNAPLSQEQSGLLRKLIEEVWEEEK